MDHGTAPTLGRRELIVGAGAMLTAGTATAAVAADHFAKAPEGFQPFAAPGLVSHARSKRPWAEQMQPNELWPKAEVAKLLVEGALRTLTGDTDAVTAMKRFVHGQDRVAVKINGIAGEKAKAMSTNFEVVRAVVDLVLSAGVAPSNLCVYEQYPTYLQGCRINVDDWKLPEGVAVEWHGNFKCKGGEVATSAGHRTQFCAALLESTALIGVSLFKDHSICGYTGAMKNITHGSISNPDKHHDGQANPHIAAIFQQPAIRTRARLFLADAFLVQFDKGPLDRGPETRAGHGGVYASTDAVALDVLGSEVVEGERLKRGLPSLEAAGRPPRYLASAAQLGLGIAHRPDIALRTVELP